MDLCVYDKCNNQCLQCTNPDSPWPAWDGSFDYDYDSITKRLRKDKAKFLADDSIYLTGGEPTIHPDFLEILKYLASNFPKQRIKLLTNGRRFMYEDFARQVLRINDNFEIDLSIYGPDETAHDKVTRSRGSFRQTIAGLRNILNLKNRKQVIGVRFIVTGLSYKHIGDFLEMLLAGGFGTVDRVIIVFWEAEAQAVKNLKETKVDFRKTRPYLDKALPLFGKFRDLRLYHFPLCTLPVRAWPYAWRTLPAHEVTFLPVCHECLYKDLCLGVQKTYLKYVDREGFAALKRPIGVEESGDFYKPIKGISKR
ncbi:hypothetical protein A2303_05335 [Candidatus Falkowbacteria bacterium RIFOXYB2_FULL_47_14]|uniref:Radical SAM core domain-containing protein n=1 Tax=Candidatus Falkowbacteria bacterium RIFOXYA2_FULL_47_19 TaxID=1797994 RepID=A0A1F5SE40_9BACT|nr:MAG: hypothetical protein A2227_08045 [Candidatus Falkowbacteria bacterium RIFOXYA2_FULL_47_19]OGF34374.1 MAG: hypothetical protein A2468_05035 [Candidatus Falkowbacteria bacterium RIFOXYC2_FULL_46_15]OGF43273.1 MAG: hypothetical protein A2303_05335 [Candidatus Falkowbacteria bacterium RIFOXYB2_FULL_47_14]